MALENPTVIFKKYWLNSSRNKQTIQRPFKPNAAAAAMVCKAFGMANLGKWFVVKSNDGILESYNAKTGLVTEYAPIFALWIKIVDSAMCQ